MGIMDKIKKEKTTKPAKKVEKKAEKVETKTEAKVPGNVSTASMHTIIRPLVTEKAAVMQSIGTYAFVVNKETNKIEVKKAIKELYGVEPVSVRIVNVQGHRVRFGKNAGKRSDYKKAIVSLKKGDSITIHEGV